MQGWLQSCSHYYGSWKPLLLKIKKHLSIRWWRPGRIRPQGASRFRIMWNIIVPVITPGIASVAMFSFLNSWNHLLYVMILNTREKLLTVPMGLLREYASSYFYYYATMSAGLLVIIIPIALVYIPFQKYFASGLTAGALKG